jgi:hypothetical protein
MSRSRVIALFGATGKTGRVVLQHLRSAEDSAFLELHVYVRSTKKLQGLFPDILSDQHVEIFEGSIADIDLLENCCRGVDTIICTMGENENLPTVSVLEDTAHGILESLRRLQEGEGGTFQKPKLILLSSSTWNPKFAAARPLLVHWMIKTAFSYPYADLLRAQTKYMENSSLLTMILIQPPLLVEEEGTGYEISTEAVRLACSYPDLGAAMAEIVMDQSYHSLSAVGVSSKLGDRPLRYAPEIFRRIFWGMFAYVQYFFVPVETVARKTK